MPGSGCQWPPLPKQAPLSPPVTVLNSKQTNTLLEAAGFKCSSLFLGSFVPGKLEAALDVRASPAWLLPVPRCAAAARK